MPNHTVPEDSDLRKCPRCSTSWNRIASGDGCCPCLVESKPAIPLTQSEIDLMLADSKQANELLRERVAELEKALRPFADAAAPWEPNDAARILSRVRWGYENQPDLCVTVGHLLEAARVLGGAK